MNPVRLFRLGRILFPLAAALLAASCQATHPTVNESGAPYGGAVIHGHLYAEGGPAPGPPRPLAGSVTITPTNGSASTTRPVGSGGIFDLFIPAGTYELSGHSPLYMGSKGTCNVYGGKPFTVNGGEHMTMDVVCQEK